ncbi:MAG: hypothetical protein QM668_18695 [Agriterribacter sp.]
MENSSSDTLLIFVGEKIKVSEQREDSLAFDNKFICKYKILETVCGPTPNDSIVFTAYDHYGDPAFSQYKHVLLYVVKYNGKYYHEKYLFDALYKTKDGRWASPYNIKWYSRLDSGVAVSPEKIEFAQPVFFDIAKRKKQFIRKSFPSPYYNIAAGKAVAAYGNYIPELIEIKKRGVLMYRGFYGQKDSNDYVIPEIELPPYSGKSIKISKTEYSQLKKVAEKLFNAIIEQDDNAIKEIALDSVSCSPCEGFAEIDFYNDTEPIDSFITGYHRTLLNTQIWDLLKKKKYSINPILQPEYQHIPISEMYYTIELQSDTILNGYKYVFEHSFEFIKLNNTFKFRGMRSQHTSTIYPQKS